MAEPTVTVADAHVVVRTTEFAADFEILTGDLGFRIDAVFPADSPTTAIVSIDGLRLRLERIDEPAGWVRVVYEDQGEPFVMQAGDCVLQPPEIRH